ncbi:vicilin Cor a 11.0101-like [Humulus lupulus]|uniref:vicilin Cor a 11.0101-like n=1 Tax=Humulus lupulus TaxID=3486 RepID=UPI002B402C45|nr:vicilin Cor a 11.0101-like [Humulus lupulus]
MAAFKLSLLILLLLFVVVPSSSVDVSVQKDPELKQCRHQCTHQTGFDEAQKSQCEQKCKEYIRDKREQERRERGGRDEKEDESHYNRKEREETRSGEGERVTERSPYVFEEEHFETSIKTEEGRVHILRKFTEKSKLLKGIENYRVGFLEANPSAFIAPVHLDADCVFFVATGKPTVTLLREDKRETFNLVQGDILTIPAGTPVYIVNRDENEKLFIVKLINPVSLPGRFEPFYGAGGETPETFYRGFSWEVLSAAFKRERDELERLFRQQKRGSIVKASRQQVQELSRHAEGGGGTVWPFGQETRSSGPFNLFRKHATQSNRFGRLYEANPSDHKQLQDLDVMITFANITQGAMAAPFYNSRATKIAFVLDGEGYLEMACPHISSEQGRRGSPWQGEKENRPEIQRVTGRLRRGVVFVVPAGHPVTTIASGNNNLQIVCFVVNAEGNVRYPLAGKRNIVTEMENVAKELAFSVPAREVDRVFKSQNEEFFFPGPRSTQQEEGGQRAYAS